MANPQETAPAPAPTGAPPPQTAPAAAESGPPTRTGPGVLDRIVAAMGVAQLMIVGGALLLVLVDLLLGILFDEYYASSLVWLGSAVLLLAYVVNSQRPSSLPIDYRALLLGGAAVVALVGLRDIVLDLIDLLRFTTSWDAVELLGLLLYIGGIAAVAFGGWQLWRGRR